MQLNAPSLTCPNCRGKGVWVRSLKLIVNGSPASSPSRVLLHCSCLSDELKLLHAQLTETGIFRNWPWDELKNLSIPQADGGPAPSKLGTPVAVKARLDFKLRVPERPAQAPAPIVRTETPAPEPKPRRGRSKMKD